MRLHFPLFAILAFALAWAPAWAQAPIYVGPASTPAGIGAVGPVINIVAYGASPSNSSAVNTTDIQNAITAAQTTGEPLYIPANASCYNYTPPLTITSNIEIIGDSAQENWNSGINIPGGTPALLGSVLCPASNGGDAIDITGTSLVVNIKNLGILFQTAFSGTGDGIHYVPSGTAQGLSGSLWQNVKVYGHDGNHYAFNLQNFIYDTFINEYSYGGGIFNLYGSSSAYNYGNSTFVEPFGQLVVGGTANGYNLGASASQRLNLLEFVRPQMLVNGVSYPTNPPTNAQSIWSQGPNVTNVTMHGPDMETSVSAPMTIGATPNGIDWNSMYTDAGAINAPSWGSNGIMYGPLTRTFNDTTSSGSLTIEATAAFPAVHVTASSAVTITHVPTLYLGVPISGTNVTATRPESLYTAGAIYDAGNVTTAGLYDTGNTQINTNAGSATTEVGDGTSSGLVTIGGTSNKVLLGPGTTLTSTTVASLPACAGRAGYMELVTDASSPTYGGPLTGGGSTYAFALCNGTSWLAH